MILIIGVSTSALLEYAVSSQRLTRRRIERENLIHTAEAGVDQVIHYLNYPGDFTDDSTLFTQDPTTESYYTVTSQNVFATRTLSPLIDYDSDVNGDLIVFSNEPINSAERARVIELDLSLPTAADLAEDGSAMLVVSSTATLAEDLGRAPDARRTRTVRAVLSADAPFVLYAPAAIISHRTLGADGQYNVHWGQTWARSEMDIGNVDKITAAWADPYASLFTESWYRKGAKYADGSNNWNDTPLDPADPNYHRPWNLDPAVTEDHENLHQQWDFDANVWPNYSYLDGWEDLILDYEQWKVIAQRRGLYFTSDDAGYVYLGTEENSRTRMNTGDLYEYINTAAEIVLGATPDEQVLPEPMIIFIDTTDGQPPNGIPAGEPGSNLCDIQMSGGKIFASGVLYVAGNLTLGGSGGAPTIWAETPDLTYEQILCNYAGVIYTEGIYDQGGSRYLYGAIMARGGFGTGGGPDVYYDHRLAYGLPFPFNSEASVTQWTEISPSEFSVVASL
jgi:hypothetical protein